MPRVGGGQGGAVPVGARGGRLREHDAAHRPPGAAARGRVRQGAGDQGDGDAGEARAAGRALAGQQRAEGGAADERVARRAGVHVQGADGRRPGYAGHGVPRVHIRGHAVRGRAEGDTDVAAAAAATTTTGASTVTIAKAAELKDRPHAGAPGGHDDPGAGDTAGHGDDGRGAGVPADGADAAGGDDPGALRRLQRVPVAAGGVQGQGGRRGLEGEGRVSGSWRGVSVQGTGGVMID